MPLTTRLQILGKRTADSLHAAHYNHLSKKAAFKALREIEKERGKLGSARKNKADEYAVEVLGGKRYAPWLYVYTVLSGAFKEGWIPDNYYHLMVIPKIQGDYGKISFLKPLNRKVFNTTISPDIAFFVNGSWYDLNFTKMRRENLETLAFARNERIVYKVDHSFQGRGILMHDKTNFNLTILENSGNGTLQRYIEQHRFFTDFHSGSVGTIRMTTVIDPEGRADLRASYLRLGRADDTYVKSDSHVRIPINLVSGELEDHGYLSDWRTILHHPDSMSRFTNKIIPGYNECIRSALALHQSFPMVTAIGWDFAVDEENRPILMEWNGYGNDIKFSEATQGPCFEDLEWDKL